MRILIAAIVFVGICVFGMCFNIIFRKKDFPEYEVSKNKEMRKLGIKCMHELEQEDLFDKNEKKDKKHSSCSGVYTDECVGCGLYPKKQNNEK